MTERLQANETQRRALLADVAHELRTPLSVIRGNVEGMLDGVYPADDRHLAPLLEETAVMARLLDDLQTLSTAEAGVPAPPRARRPARPRPGHDGRVPGQGGPGRVGLACRPAAPVPEVDVDPVRIGEVLANLLTNAIRHTPRGGSVEVVVGPDPAGVAVSVADTGPGIDARDLPHVFDRFVKSADSGGAGLGLAIARSLVEAHGGQITAQSTPGQGTVMRFVLRLWKTPPVRRGDGLPLSGTLRACSIEGDATGIPTEADGWVGVVTNGELGATGQKIYDYIRESHATTGLVPTVREIREAIGVKSIGTVGYWLDKLEALNLIRRDAGKNRSIQLRGESPTVPVPLVGEIRAGSPILAEERVDGNFVLPRQLVGEGTLFMLRVRGDSMIDAQIAENDYVVVRAQRDAQNGDIVAAPSPAPRTAPPSSTSPARATGSACSPPTRSTSRSRSAPTGASWARWSRSAGSEARLPATPPGAGPP